MEIQRRATSHVLLKPSSYSRTGFKPSQGSLRLILGANFNAKSMLDFELNSSKKNFEGFAVNSTQQTPTFGFKATDSTLKTHASSFKTPINSFSQNTIQSTRINTQSTLKNTVPEMRIQKSLGHQETPKELNDVDSDRNMSRDTLDQNVIIETTPSRKRTIKEQVSLFDLGISKIA